MLLRKWKREEPPQRRYADVPAGYVAPLPPDPDGRVSIRLTMRVDIEAWARAHGVTVEHAQQELGQRISDATTPMLGKLTTELGDMGPSILSATVSTGG